MPPAFALSQDQTLKFIPFKTNLAKSSISLQTKRKPKLTYSQRTSSQSQTHANSKRFLYAFKRNTSDNASDHDDPIHKLKQSPNLNQTTINIPKSKPKPGSRNQPPQVTPQKPETPPTYPFPAYSIVKQQFRPPQPSAN
jgi:hypothetical protein